MTSLRSGTHVHAFRDIAERTAKLLPWWLLFGCITVSWLVAVYGFLARGTSPLVVPARPSYLRFLFLVDSSACALLFFGFWAVKPSPFSSLARKMLAVALLEWVALTVSSAIAPLVATHLLNLVVIAFYCGAFVAALGFVLVRTAGEGS